MELTLRKRDGLKRTLEKSRQLLVNLINRNRDCINILRPPRTARSEQKRRISPSNKISTLSRLINRNYENLKSQAVHKRAFSNCCTYRQKITKRTTIGKKIRNEYTTIKDSISKQLGSKSAREVRPKSYGCNKQDLASDVIKDEVKYSGKIEIDAVHTEIIRKRKVFYSKLQRKKEWLLRNDLWGTITKID